MNVLRIAALAALFAPLVEAQSHPCVQAGTTVPITFTRPPLVANGMPVNAQWHPDTAGNPQAYESDTFSNDPMGPATVGNPADSVTVSVTNQGGNLNDSTGRTQNGDGEGDCIEVIVCWEYRYPVTISRSDTTGIKIREVNAGSTTGVSIVLWRVATICSEEVVVCPC